MNIRECRKKKGLTMKQLGEAVGVSESSISLYETGKREPDFEMILRIARALDVSLTELTGLTEQWNQTVQHDVILPIQEAERLKQDAQGAPRTQQARILAAGIDRMPERDREKALNLVMMMFEQYADFFERSDDDDK